MVNGELSSEAEIFRDFIRRSETELKM